MPDVRVTASTTGMARTIGHAQAVVVPISAPTLTGATTSSARLSVDPYRVSRGRFTPPEATLRLSAAFSGVTSPTLDHRWRDIGRPGVALWDAADAGPIWPSVHTGDAATAVSRPGAFVERIPSMPADRDSARRFVVQRTQSGESVDIPVVQTGVGWFVVALRVLPSSTNGPLMHVVTNHGRVEVRLHGDRLILVNSELVLSSVNLDASGRTVTVIGLALDSSRITAVIRDGGRTAQQSWDHLDSDSAPVITGVGLGGDLSASFLVYAMALGRDAGMAAFHSEMVGFVAS